MSLANRLMDMDSVRANNSDLCVVVGLKNMIRRSRLRWGLTLPIFAAVTFGGQFPRMAAGETYPLPKTTGAPLTIVPIDRPDIDRSIQEWSPTPPRPFVKLLCPSLSEFAPLRVYLKLSWISPDDVPTDLDQFGLPAGGLTKIRTNSNAVLVRLETMSQSGGRQRERWVSFNGVVDMALIKDHR
jgi:hypothetical protein